MNEFARLQRAYDAIEGPTATTVATARDVLLGEIAAIETPRTARPRRKWLVVAFAGALLVAGLLVSPAFGVGTRLLDLIRGDAPRTPEVSGPTWSPDGRRIAVKGWNGDRHNYDVYVMKADGAELRNLTSDLTLVTDPSRKSSEGGPVWSPDGRRIVFGRDPGYNVGELRVINADGSAERRLTAGSDPVWSPDGRKIAFRKLVFINNRVAYRAIFVMNADGSRERNLTRNPEFDYGQPVWSADGSKIAYARASRALPNPSGANASTHEIYVMSADGSGQRRLTRNAVPDWHPIWSPDGLQLAFIRQQGRDTEIYVMSADGSGQRLLTRHAEFTRSPVWSPDGRRIAFVVRRRGNAEIFVVNADGSGQQNLSRNSARDADPAWSPDGRKLLFISDRGGIFALYVMNVDGSRQQKVT